MKYEPTRQHSTRVGSRDRWLALMLRFIERRFQLARYSMAILLAAGIES